MWDTGDMERNISMLYTKKSMVGVLSVNTWEMALEPVALEVTP